MIHTPRSVADTASPASAALAGGGERVDMRVVLPALLGKHRFRGGAMRICRRAIAACVVVALAGLTAVRNADYRTQVALRRRSAVRPTRSAG